MTPEPQPHVVVRQYDTVGDARAAWRRVREYYATVPPRSITCSSVICGPHSTAFAVLVVHNRYDAEKFGTALGGTTPTDPCWEEVGAITVQRHTEATGSCVREGVFDHVARCGSAAASSPRSR